RRRIHRRDRPHDGGVGRNTGDVFGGAPMIDSPRMTTLADEKISLLAKVARTRSPRTGAASAGPGEQRPISGESILSLAAASYGARPADDATVPTGFDPIAVALFEAIVEGAYLVAAADGVVDDEERRVFERVVAAACGGAVAPKHIADLVADLADQLSEDGMDRRLQVLGQQV